MKSPEGPLRKSLLRGFQSQKVSSGAVGVILRAESDGDGEAGRWARPEALFGWVRGGGIPPREGTMRGQPQEHHCMFGPPAM
eukprot:15472371-Alexandrium_andersonii.AAC.1